MNRIFFPTLQNYVADAISLWLLRIRKFNAFDVTFTNLKQTTLQRISVLSDTLTCQTLPN